MMLFSKPYNYYKDRDDENLGLKIRHGLKTGIESGTWIAGADMMMHHKPKNFAHFFSIFGKWMTIFGVAFAAHSALTYVVAKQTGVEHSPFNHFAGGLAPGLFAGYYFKKHFPILITTLMFGAWAAHEKWTMHVFNASALDPRSGLGTGGLYQGQFAAYMPFTRTFLQNEDPGRRPN